MKNKTIILALVLLLTLGLAGCGGATEPADTQTPEADATAGATELMADNEENLLNAISENGAWIILFDKDMTTDKELVLEGEFVHREEAARKLALYEQDADRNKTATFTLTAPKLTVRSENARIQGGTFVGDVYVEANGFSVIDATVEGNIYFASEEYQESFTLDEGTVTGANEVKN